MRDSEGKVIGKKTIFSLAKYLRDALPNATYLGFTGTPIEKKDATARFLGTISPFTTSPVQWMARP